MAFRARKKVSSALWQRSKRALKIHQMRAVPPARRHDAPDKEAVCSDDLVMVQDTFERGNRGLQDRHTEHALLPCRRLKALGPFGSVAAGEPKSQILLVAAEQADAKSAVGEDGIMCLGRGLDADQ